MRGLLQTDKNRHRCILGEGFKTSSQDLKQNTWECWFLLLIGYSKKVSVMSKECDWTWHGHCGEHTCSYHLCSYMGAGTVLTSVCYTWRDIWLHMELSKEAITACLDTMAHLHAEASHLCHSCTALLRQCATAELHLLQTPGSLPRHSGSSHNT